MPQPAAHIFSETPLEPFNPDRLIPEIQRLAEIIDNIKIFIAFPNYSCSIPDRHRKELLALLGFQDTPANWVDIYVEYRFIVQKTYTLYEPILSVCASGGGTVESDVRDTLGRWLDTAHPQVEQLLGKAYQIPQP